jgi:membrane-associated phospholipid phosphatase
MFPFMGPRSRTRSLAYWLLPKELRDQPPPAWRCDGAWPVRVDQMRRMAVMAGSVVLENGLKYALHRAHPEPYFGASPETFSFPSGHSLFSACFYVSMAIAACCSSLGKR